MHTLKRAAAAAILAATAVDCLAQDTEAPVYVRRGLTTGPRYHAGPFAAGQSPFGVAGPYGGGFHPGFVGPVFPPYWGFGFGGVATQGNFRGYTYSRPYPTHLDWQAVRLRAPHLNGPGHFHGYADPAAWGLPVIEEPAVLSE
ncbi:MAG: hypothetical protein AAGA92_11310 [Planctomycetota bacterium]